METAVSPQIWLTVFFLALVGYVIYFLYHRASGKTQQEKKAYLLALKYIAENDTRRAIEKLKETVRTDTNNIDAYIKLGDILRREGLVNNAVRIHKDLTLRGNVDSEDKGKIWFSLGLDYLAAEKYDKAETCFLELKNKKEYVKRIAPFLIRIYEKTESYQKAFNLLKESENIVAENRHHKMAIYKIFEGQKSTAEKDHKKARILFKEALKYDPACIFAHLYLGDSYIEEQRPDDALEVWKNFCKKYPQKSYVMFSRLEKAWYDKGQFNKIEELYDSILKEDPDNVQATLALSRFLRKKGEFDTALSLVNQRLVNNGDQDLLMAELARIYWDRENFKQAGEAALGILEKHIANSVTYTCKQCGYQANEPFLKCPECGYIG